MLKTVLENQSLTRGSNSNNLLLFSFSEAQNPILVMCNFAMLLKKAFPGVRRTMQEGQCIR